MVDETRTRSGRRWRTRIVATMAVLGGVVVLGASMAAADGTETLGTPSVAVAGGTGSTVAGVGLGGPTVASGVGTGVPNQAGTFSVTVPAGATVEQVLLYWEGHFVAGTTPDNTVTLNGTAVTGTLIGGPTPFFGTIHAAAYRADVTALGAVGTGTSSLTVAGMDNSFANNGAGVVVIFDDGGAAAALGLRDGQDLAFRDFPSPLDTTVPQTFTFAAEATARTAQLGIMAASVAPDRPNVIRVTTGGVTTDLVNLLFSGEGPEWDAKNISVTIPGGATSLTVQVLSVGDDTPRLPASLAWVVGSLSVPTTPPPPPPPPGAGTGTPGYWKNHPEAWPVTTLTLGGQTYTQAQLVSILKSSTSKDMTDVLAAHLIAAKLNVSIGTDPSCITATIAAADAWLASNPIGSGVTAKSAAWKVGEPLKSTLDAYNNGELCAPSRD